MNTFKTQITISRQGAEYLAVSIDNWLENRSQPGKDKMLVTELLATSYLFNVRNRLITHVIKSNLKAKLDFKITLSVQEIFAILLCVPITPENSFLRKVLSDLHQKSLNYEFLLKNNQFIYV